MIFEQYRGTSWSEVVAALEDAVRAMLREVERRGDEALTAVDPHTGGRNPVWVGIAYYGIAHSVVHIAQALVRAGNPEGAIRLQKKMTTPLLAVDSSAAWKGMVEMYLARVLSLAGSLDEAVRQYRQAVIDNPGLALRTADEPDLEAIRDRI